MTQEELAQTLAMIKLDKGSTKIKADSLPQYSMYSELETRGYLKNVASDEVEDDEGLLHYTYYFEFTDKAHKLLRRKARELSMRPLR